MPAYLTHRLAVGDVQNRIQDEKILAIITNNQKEYTIGGQGCDFAFFRRYYCLVAYCKTKIYGGWLAHRARPRAYLLLAAQYVKSKKDPALEAYYFGYLVHYCLDKYLHPLVNTDTHNISTHTYLEQALDVVYAKKRGIDAQGFRRNADLAAHTVSTDTLDAFHEYMAAVNYDGYKLPKRSFSDSMKWWARFTRRTDDSGKFTHALMRVQNIIMPFDIVAFIYRPYDEIKDRYDFGKYFTRLEAAIKEALEYISLAYGYFHEGADISVLSSVFYNVNFSGQALSYREDRKAFKKAYKKAKAVK